MLKFFKSPIFLLLLLSFFILVLVFNFFLSDKDWDSTYWRIASGINHQQVTVADFATTKMNRVLSSPVLVFLPLFLSSFFGGFDFGNFNFSLLMMNVVFYFLTVIFFYLLVQLIYQSSRVALIAAVIFFTNYAMVSFGLNAGADMAGWAFMVMTSYWAVKYFKEPQKTKFYFLAILTASLGMFFKEYAILGMLTLGTLIIFLKERWSAKIIKLLGAGALFLIIPGLYHLFYYFKFGYTYLAFYDSAARLDNYDLILLIKVLGSLFTIGWFYFLFGLYQEYRNRDPRRTEILLGLLPASLAFFGWALFSQRGAFG